MPVIDVQVHPFDRNHPGRPWASPSHGLSSATGEEMVAAMNSVGERAEGRAIHIKHDLEVAVRADVDDEVPFSNCTTFR